MKLNLKFSSQQIIIVLVAFLIGIGGTLLVTRQSENGQPSKDSVKEEAAVNQEETAETASSEEPGTTVNSTTKTTTVKTTTTTASKPATEFVTGKCKTGLSGRKDTKLNAIVLSWNPCASDDFQFYKLVKSSKSSNPTYGVDGIAYSSANKNAASFVDKTVAQRTTYYYKMCVVQRLNSVNCSNVATVSF